MTPDDAAKFAPHPAVNFLKWPFALTELEVACHPRSTGFIRSMTFAILWPRAAGLLPVEQAPQTHRRHSQPRLLMPAHPITQIVAGPRPCYVALFPVQRRFQALIQEALNTGHNPCASPLTAHINVRIVRILHETMSPSFQLAVEFVEQDVRQQRRERAAFQRLRAGVVLEYFDQFSVSVFGHEDEEAGDATLCNYRVFKVLAQTCLCD